MDTLLLSNRQKEKILELCLRAYPEFPYVQLDEQGFVEFRMSKKDNMPERIFWFELVLNEMVHRLLENRTYKLTAYYHQVMTRRAIHPVNYLYNLIFYNNK